MKACQLRNQIVIQTNTLTVDGIGGNTETWATFATVWARIEPLSANQVFFSESLQHRVTHKITIRDLASLSSKMRISFDSRIFYIKSFRDLLEKNRFTEIMAEEGAAS